MKMFEQFFASDAKVELVDGRLSVTLPDGRSMTVEVASWAFHNPNAKPLPPFDFRDHLGKPDGETSE